MITRETGFKTENGFFETLEAAKKASLVELLEFEDLKSQSTDAVLAYLSDAILKRGDKVVDILTTTERSITKARRINGGTKKRKAKSALPPAEASTTV